MTSYLSVFLSNPLLETDQGDRWPGWSHLAVSMTKVKLTGLWVWQSPTCQFPLQQPIAWHAGMLRRVLVVKVWAIEDGRDHPEPGGKVFSFSSCLWPRGKNFLPLYSCFLIPSILNKVHVPVNEVQVLMEAGGGLGLSTILVIIYPGDHLKRKYR